MQALVLLGEANQGYPEHFFLAIGHLAEASDELVQKYPEQANSGYGWSGSNINMLTPSGPDYDPSTGGITLRGLPCRVLST